jgi:23S rRNA pseudouridine1911/1915/1917 synthase
MSEELEDLLIQGEENDLYEHFRFVVDKGQSLLRIDKYLQGKIPGISRNKIQHASHAGNILVNNDAVKPNYRVHPNDIITVVLTYPPRDTEIIPENLHLEILFEDDVLLVINKKAGMVVHPAHGNYSGTLVNALAYHFQNEGIVTESGPYLVHRIDKDTSGLLLVAKDELTQSILARSFFEHKVDRKYQALVWGDLKEDEGRITGHIGRSQRDRQMMDVYTDGSYGKEAITHYRVLKRYKYVTLVECILETGRTHQIRAHMKHIGHPLFNDAKYGGDKILKGTTFSKYKHFIEECFAICSRQALHAKTLSFRHPSTGDLIIFESQLPDDMSQLLARWEKYVNL